MYVAFISDVHLQENSLDKFSALRWVLADLSRKGVKYLFIAGDFCEGYPYPYSQIKDLFAAFPDIFVYVLLGNHDYKGGKFSSDFINLPNVRIVDVPQLVHIERNTFLLLPYQESKSMSEDLYESVCRWQLKVDEFILVSHGDLLYGDVYYEDDGYFPLFVCDIKRISPKLVILGHIHSGPRYPDIKVYYCGSLYPMNQTELGFRYYALLDLSSSTLDWIPVGYGPIYWKERMWLLGKDVRLQVDILMDKLKTLFSVRSDWKEAISLDLDVFCFGEIDLSSLEMELRRRGLVSFNLSPVLVVERMQDLEMLVNDFLLEVESLCSSENDVIDWAIWKDDIIFSGMNMLQDIIRRMA